MLQSDTSTATILVVDDDKTITSLIRTILEKDGHTVIVANRGEDGLRLAKEKKPDLVIVDIGMPDIDGYQVSSTLKSEAELRDIPILFLSGRDPGEDRGRSFASGGLTYIRKPFSNQQIRDMVRLTLQSLAS